MPKHILVADDSVTIQRVVQITFAHEDITLATAKTADEALQRAREKRPDLVLADAGMPGKSGYDLCQAVKSDGALAGVSVLIMSSQAAPFDEGKGKAAGADGFVQKPFDTQQMIDKAHDAISKGSKASAAAAPVARTPTPVTTPAATPAPVAPAPPVQRQPSMPPRSQTMMGMPPVAMPMRPATPATPAAPPARPAVTPTPAAKPAPAAAASASLPAPPPGLPRPPMLRGQTVGQQRAARRDARGPEYDALTALSREVIEKICWEILPDLAEAIIKEQVARQQNKS